MINVVPASHEQHLARAVELSRGYESDPLLTPFGAVVVVDGVVVGEGVSAVMRDVDPTAHAEVNAIRDACARSGAHILPPGAVMYSSSEPCPMCLTACMWAGIADVYFAASVEDSARCGFEDREYYEDLRRHWAGRRIREVQVQECRPAATAALVRWHEVQSASGLAEG